MSVRSLHGVRYPAGWCCWRAVSRTVYPVWCTYAMGGASRPPARVGRPTARPHRVRLASPVWVCHVPGFRPSRPHADRWADVWWCGLRACGLSVGRPLARSTPIQLGAKPLVVLPGAPLSPRCSHRAYEAVDMRVCEAPAVPVPSCARNRHAPVVVWWCCRCRGAVACVGTRCAVPVDGVCGRAWGWVTRPFPCGPFTRCRPRVRRLLSPWCFPGSVDVPWMCAGVCDRPACVRALQEGCCGCCNDGSLPVCFVGVSLPGPLTCVRRLCGLCGAHTCVGVPVCFPGRRCCCMPVRVCACAPLSPLRWLVCVCQWVWCGVCVCCSACGRACQVRNGGG